MKTKTLLFILALFGAFVCSVLAAPFQANQGQTVTFAVTADGTTPFTYQWAKNGVVISGATAASLVLPNVQSADAATYTVTVKNSAGQTVAPGAVFTLAVIPPSNAVITGSAS